MRFLKPRSMQVSVLKSVRYLSNIKPIGMVGLGHMGIQMKTKLAENTNRKIYINDVDESKMNALAMPNIIPSSLETIARECEVIVTMLPNDEIVNRVSKALIDTKVQKIHLSCSTISPTTSRSLESLHFEHNHIFVACPVFARPDGIAKKQATWLVSGAANGRNVAKDILSSMGNVIDLGDDVGTANVVKLCGNFMIASSIESIAESMALAEKHGVDRNKVMNILSSTIFDCLIYRGYGQRVSERDHQPGGFSLNLGLKDMTLVNQAAREADVPMPFLSILLDRYVSAKARGRSGMDWSAIGLSVAEDAGINIQSDLQKNVDHLKK